MRPTGLRFGAVIKKNGKYFVHGFPPFRVAAVCCGCAVSSCAELAGFASVPPPRWCSRGAEQPLTLEIVGYSLGMTGEISVK